MTETTARAVIAKLRQRQTPSRQELAWFAQGLADHTVSDAQAGAFAMAVCLNGLGDVGRVALTIAMRDSGSVLSWELDGPVSGQALDRRRRRLRQPIAGPRLGRMWRLCSDDFGPWFGPHGRHAG